MTTKIHLRADRFSRMTVCYESVATENLEYRLPPKFVALPVEERCTHCQTVYEERFAKKVPVPQ